ncbi:unnamed protein product [Durusdinium trenchii]|uniref:Uncharacterized protein n=1 Tax=Durusdinium trenchii TaxID=1381693 RepID=A0ABP0L6R9_9DINO
MIRELWEDEIRGEGFGESKFKLYESNEGLREDDANPYFVVWLHGMHCGMIGPKDLKTMQWRLQRRVIFMVPLSPRPCDGLSFNWGCAFTKQQNKKLLEILLTKSAAEFAEEGSWSKDSWLKRLLGKGTCSKDPGYPDPPNPRLDTQKFFESGRSLGLCSVTCTTIF